MQRSYQHIVKTSTPETDLLRSHTLPNTTRRNVRGPSAGDDAGRGQAATDPRPSLPGPGHPPARTLGPRQGTWRVYIGACVCA